MNSLSAYLKNLINHFLAYWLGFWILLGFIIMWPAMYVSLSIKKLNFVAHWLRKMWARWTFFWGFVRLEQIIEEPFDVKKVYIITPNHSSKLDIFSLIDKLPLHFAFIAKIELARIPLYGKIIKTLDITVDRNIPNRAASAYLKAKQVINEGKSIVFYPEANISRTAPLLSPFKKGAFKLAIEKQIDILPVSIVGMWKILPEYGKFYFTPGHVIQYIHKPISTKGMTDKDVEALKQKVFSIIENKLAEYGHFE